MPLKELWEIISPYTNLLILAKINACTEEMFDVEVMRGNRKQGLRQEYIDWLFALNLKVSSINCCKRDVEGNEELLCIHCEPIYVYTEEKKC